MKYSNLLFVCLLFVAAKVLILSENSFCHMHWKWPQWPINFTHTAVQSSLQSYGPLSM